jgi:hypothetical protein
MKRQSREQQRPILVLWTHSLLLSKAKVNMTTLGHHKELDLDLDLDLDLELELELGPLRTEDYQLG